MGRFWRRRYPAGPHVINNDVLNQLAVHVQSPLSPEGREPEKMTILTAFNVCARTLPTNGTVGFANLSYLGFETPDGKYQIHGDHFSRNVLELLLTLHSRGADWYGSMWFCYGREERLDGIRTTAHRFFVVSYDDRIIEPQATLYDGPDESFRRDVLTPVGTGDYQVWSWQRTYAEALARLWYPRFYEQTIPGQLMVVRPDRPRLFRYSRPLKSYSREIKVVLGIIVAVLLLMRLLR